MHSDEDTWGQDPACNGNLTEHQLQNLPTPAHIILKVKLN